MPRILGLLFFLLFSGCKSSLNGDAIVHQSLNDFSTYINFKAISQFTKGEYEVEGFVRDRSTVRFLFNDFSRKYNVYIKINNPRYQIDFNVGERVYPRDVIDAPYDLRVNVEHELVNTNRRSDTHDCGDGRIEKVVIQENTYVYNIEMNFEEFKGENILTLYFSDEYNRESQISSGGCY